MTTQPEPLDDSYPSAWKPDYIREREAKLEPSEIEQLLAAMPTAERAAMLRRIGAMS